MRKRYQKLPINLPRRQIVKILTISTLIAVCIYIATQVPPSSILISLSFALLLSFLGGFIVSFFARWQLSLLCTFYIFVLLALGTIIGPNILNTILLSSFIIGVAILIK